MYGGVFMFNGGKLRRRTVIDVNTAECIGYVSDIEIDESAGTIRSIIVRRRIGFFASILSIGEISVPWRAITAMSDDFVLVKSFELGEG